MYLNTWYFFKNSVNLEMYLNTWYFFKNSVNLEMYLNTWYFFKKFGKFGNVSQHLVIFIQIIMPKIIMFSA